jgi:ActD protein
MRDMRLGLMAEFRSARELLLAVARLRALGLRRLDAYTPYPVRELEPLLEIKRSFVPKVVFGMALLGACTGYGLQWWCAAVAYPLNVGARPYHSAPAFIPITFETGVLFAALTAFVLPLILAGLPRLYRPVFEVDGFESVSVDGYWVAVGADDPKLDRVRAEAELQDLGAKRVVRVESRRK